jgi:hypothetical protein
MFAKANDSVQPLSAVQQAPLLSVTKPTKDRDDQVSTISRGVTVVGKIVGEVTIHALGQIKASGQCFRSLAHLTGTRGGSWKSCHTSQKLTCGLITWEWV